MYRGANYKMYPGPYHIRMLIYSFRKRKEKNTFVIKSNTFNCDA